LVPFINKNKGGGEAAPSRAEVKAGRGLKVSDHNEHDATCTSNYVTFGNTLAVCLLLNLHFNFNFNVVPPYLKYAFDLCFMFYIKKTYFLCYICCEFFIFYLLLSWV